MYAVFLYYFAKFWGLAPFAWTSSRPCVGSAKELLYPSILALLCILEFFNTMVNRLSTDKAGLTTITNIGSNLSNQIGDLTGGLYLVTFTIKRRKIVQIINMSYKVDGMLSLLGVEQNYKKISKRWATLVGLSSAAIFIVVYGTCLTYWIPIGSITLSACYAYVIGPLDHFIHHHVELLFVIVMDFVRNRYEQLNDRLISVWPHEPALGVDLERHDFSRNREALIADARRHHIIPVYGGVSKPSEKLRIIAELSKILHEITDSVVEVASLPIMLNLTYYFVFSLTVIYYLFITAPTAYATSDYVTMAQLFGGGVWTGLMLCELLAVAAICSLTQKTVRILNGHSYLFSSLAVSNGTTVMLFCIPLFSFFCPRQILLHPLSTLSGTSVILQKLKMRYVRLNCLRYLPFEIMFMLFIYSILGAIMRRSGK